MTFGVTIEAGGPRTNRVDPFGRIFATPAKGGFMGNRGCLHDAQGRMGPRAWKHRHWIICALAFNGRRRTLMTPGEYTELFFLDEPTALAAGHRPCWECRRLDAKAFAAAFAAAHPELGSKPAAHTMDVLLHRQRLDSRGGQRTWLERLGALPDGAMVALDGEPWLIWRGGRLRWSPGGYDDRRLLEPARVVDVLTPQAAVLAIQAGYRPAAHSSAKD